ncbi:hypothetical protein MTO96_041737 [Rhipicephalus appendiculatus]
MWNHGFQLLAKEALGFVRYGISNEPMAANRYEEVLQNMDRLVYDPAEGSYGVLEIKCPYSLREKKGEEHANATFCSDLAVSGPRLKTDDYYYALVVG